MSGSGACETRRVHVAATAGLGFLLAVLWFDLMFDVQVLGHHDPLLPASVVDSIAAYYRRVTTAARPMNRLIAFFMLVTLVALIGEIVGDDVRAWVAWVSLGWALAGIGLAGARTVRNAQRLGAQLDTAEVQSALARSIFRDHLVCLVAIVTALILQVVVA
jgi:hypothetical protein